MVFIVLVKYSRKRMTEMFENVEGVVCYIDDVLVWGRSKEEHDERLRKVLEVIRDNNVKLNKQKCKFAQTDIRISRPPIKP